MFTFFTHVGSAAESSLINEDFAFSKGDAEGYVVNGNTALAMAKSPGGAAVAYTDGITPRIEREGNGTAGVTGGTAWARAGRGNLSIAHSKEAQRLADRLILRPSPKPTITRTPLPLPEPSEPPRPLSKKARRRAARQQRNRGIVQGRNPNYERTYTNADIRRRHRAERESSNWELYGQESGLVITDRSDFAFVRSGQYMLTNGREAAFLDHTELGYMDSTGSGYLESTGGGYIGGGEIGYIESTEGGYYSD
jgi:hypothetical protein